MGVQSQYVVIDNAITDGPGLTPAGYSVGASRFEPLSFAPTLMEKWQIIGFTTRAAIALNARDSITPTNPVQFNGKCGSLWGGVAPQSDLQNSAGAGPIIPADLSTFTQLWNGDDPVKVFQQFALPNDPTLYTTLVQTFLLPVPMDVRSGSNLGVGIFLLPSLLGITGGAVPLIDVLVRQVTFVVLYTDGR